MKLDIISNPPTLWFGEGENKFGLDLKRFSAAERAAVIDAAISRQTAAIQHAIELLVVGWQGVADVNGTPIPFEAMDQDRRVVRNLGKFLGALPAGEQFRVMAAILAFLGVPHEDTDALVKAFCPEVETRPTAPPGGATPPTASSSSSTSAT